MPVDVAKSFAPKVIIAVDIGSSPDYGPVKNTYQLGVRALHVYYFKLSQYQNKLADVVIHPKIDQYSIFDDTANEAMYEAGRAAAIEALPQIKKALNKA